MTPGPRGATRGPGHMMNQPIQRKVLTMWPIATFTCGTRAQIAGPVRIGDNYVCPECVAKVTVSAVFLPLNWRGMYDPDKPMTEPVETGADDKPSMTIREYFARYGRTP